VKVSLKVCPKSSREEVVKGSDGNLKVYIRQAPTDGKANKALIEVLAGYYKVRKRDIRIVTGSTNRNKIVEIDKQD
jgi:uncharacterized protein (TIGR00251 family)